jgi:cellulose synthase operon protein YhjU
MLRRERLTPEATLNVSSAWRGLGWWNLYFCAKLLLYWAGSLNFHGFYNLLFAAGLLVPLPPLWLHRLRHIVAIPVGVALLYYDTWFPPFSRLLAQPEVLGFSPGYLLELLNRFVNWDMVAAGFIVLVAYLYLSQWLRLTVFSVTALVVVALSGVVTLPPLPWWPQQSPGGAQMQLAQAGTPSAPGDTNATVKVVAPPVGKPSNEQLNVALQTFFDSEKSRRTQFPATNTAPPFDVLLINICSLSWDDLRQSGLDTHPLLKNMDVIFDNFNSATAYSGPAVLRLMRASCGQAPHSELYQPAPDQCYLMENLRQLGFETKTALNHNGQFQGFLDEITAGGRFPQPYIPTETRPTMTGFDGSPIWDDLDTLGRWWKTREASGAERTALLYNTITLHDGNREATADGGGRSSPFLTRAQRLFDELNTFIGELEKSGRKVVVVLVPEHGAAVKGDKMQIAGMREIPTPDITHTPVGVRVIGAKGRSAHEPVQVGGPTSYLALSDLLARMIAGDIFSTDQIDWNALTTNLPETQAVSENEGTVMMPYNGVPYVRLGNRNWIEYPR